MPDKIESREPKFFGAAIWDLAGDVAKRFKQPVQFVWQTPFLVPRSFPYGKGTDIEALAKEMASHL